MVKRAEPKLGTEGEVLAHRVVAIIIDSIVMTLLVIMFAFFGLVGALAGPFFVILAMAGAISLTFFYAFLLEGYMGQTIGKKIMGIVVVKENGDPCDYLSSFVRNLLRIIDGIFVYLVGLIVILVSDKNQRIGDHIAGTIVVRAK